MEMWDFWQSDLFIKLTIVFQENTQYTVKPQTTLIFIEEKLLQLR